MNNCWPIALAYLRVSPEKVSPAMNRAVAGQRVVLVEEVTVELLICVVFEKLKCVFLFPRADHNNSRSPTTL